MENNESIIELTFDSTITRLAGFPYGEKVYEEQVAPRIDYSSPIVIAFPSQIVRVASSFVQGFFKEIIRNVGLEGIGKVVKLKTENEQLYSSIMNNLI